MQQAIATQSGRGEQPAIAGSKHGAIAAAGDRAKKGLKKKRSGIIVKNQIETPESGPGDRGFGKEMVKCLELPPRPPTPDQNRQK